MSRQNVYDDPQFHAGYVRLRAARAGLNEAVEQPAIASVLPPVSGLRVVDLGCGAGAQCVTLADRGGKFVVGVDPSQRMLRDALLHPRVQYVRGFAEEVSFRAGSVDVVIASMSLHYVADLGEVMNRVAVWPAPGGCFIASMEHPIMTAVALQQWCEVAEGQHHWPVDEHDREGPRDTRWFREGVVKHHRRIDTILNSVIDAGLVLHRVLEPAADEVAIAERPDLLATRRRPPIFVIRADQPAGPRRSSLNPQE